MIKSGFDFIYMNVSFNVLYIFLFYWVIIVINMFVWMYINFVYLLLVLNEYLKFYMFLI